MTIVTTAITKSSIDAINDASNFGLPGIMALREDRTNTFQQVRRHTAVSATRPTLGETLEYAFEHYDSLLRRLAD